MVIHIHLDNRDVWSSLINLFQLRIDCLAWVAPRRPKVYNGTGGSDGLLEGRRLKVDDHGGLLSMVVIGSIMTDCGGRCTAVMLCPHPMLVRSTERVQ